MLSSEPMDADADEDVSMDAEKPSGPDDLSAYNLDNYDDDGDPTCNYLSLGRYSTLETHARFTSTWPL
jgi:hypothetical protein